jgi:hypothetical protein
MLFSGHLTDAPDRVVPRFPAALESKVRAGIAAVLDRWEAGPGDVGICGGARGGDILFAELCLARGVSVRLEIALPHEEFLDSSVRVDGDHRAWERRYRGLVTNPAVTVDVAAEFDPEDTDPFAAANQRMIRIARELAGDDGFRVLVLWDERRDQRLSGGTSDFVTAVEDLARELEIVNPHDV